MGKTRYINEVAGRTLSDATIDNKRLSDSLANLKAPPETNNAASTGIENGVKSAYETGEFQDEGYTADAVMGKVDVPDLRRYSVKLADGWPMAFTANPDELVSAHDFACADGCVLRIERRIVTVVPPLLYGEGAA